MTFKAVASALGLKAEMAAVNLTPVRLRSPYPNIPDTGRPAHQLSDSGQLVLTRRWLVRTSEKTGMECVKMDIMMRIRERSLGNGDTVANLAIEFRTHRSHSHMSERVPVHADSLLKKYWFQPRHRHASVAPAVVEWSKHVQMHPIVHYAGRTDDNLMTVAGVADADCSELVWKVER